MLMGAEHKKYSGLLFFGSFSLVELENVAKRPLLQLARLNHEEYIYRLQKDLENDVKPYAEEMLGIDPFP